MKKLLTIALLTIGSFAMPSCGDDDEAKKQDPTPAAPAIEGTWNFYYSKSDVYDVNGNQVGQTKIETLSPASQIQQVFTAPSSYTEKRSSGVLGTGTYSKSGNKLTITNNGSTAAYKSGTYDIDSLTTTRLVVRDTIPNSTGGGKTIRIFKSVR